jgi:hypothetical protein
LPYRGMSRGHAPSHGRSDPPEAFRPFAPPMGTVAAAKIT